MKCVLIYNGKNYEVQVEHFNRVVNQWIQEGSLEDICVVGNCTITARTEEPTAWFDIIKGNMDIRDLSITCKGVINKLGIQKDEFIEILNEVL